jgi:hypothetical protein
MGGKSAKFGAAREIAPNGPICRFRHCRKGSFAREPRFCGFVHAEWLQRRTSPKSPKTKRELIDAGGKGWVSREGARGANGAKRDLLGAPKNFSSWFAQANHPRLGQGRRSREWSAFADHDNEGNGLGATRRSAHHMTVRFGAFRPISNLHCQGSACRPGCVPLQGISSSRRQRRCPRPPR